MRAHIKDVVGRTRAAYHLLRGLFTARHQEAGATTLELAVLFPMVLALTFASIQVGMWYQARSICQGAAQAGVRAGRALDVPAGPAASAAGSAYLHDVAGTLLLNGRVTASASTDQVRVSCAGQAQRVIPLPGLSVQVNQSAAAARERFTTR